jgi:hypothetical protein
MSTGASHRDAAAGVGSVQQRLQRPILRVIARVGPEVARGHDAAGLRGGAGREAAVYTAVGIWCGGGDDVKRADTTTGTLCVACGVFSDFMIVLRRGDERHDKIYRKKENQNTAQTVKKYP